MTSKRKENFLILVITLLISGSLVLAIIDPTFRSDFVDLAQVGISGLLGWMIPSSGSSGRSGREV